MITFYDSDGTTEINQTLNMFIGRISAVDQVQGKTIRKKFFIKDDTDEDVLATQGNNTIFSPYIIQSDEDNEEDLTGNETKFGLMEVLETDTTVSHVRVNKGVVEPSDGLWVALGNDVAEIQNTTENTDDWEFDLSVDFKEVPTGYIQLCYKYTATAGDNKEFWACIDVPSSTPQSDTVALALRAIT